MKDEYRKMNTEDRMNKTHFQKRDLWTTPQSTTPSVYYFWPPLVQLIPRSAIRQERINQKTDERTHLLR